MLPLRTPAINLTVCTNAVGERTRSDCGPLMSQRAFGTRQAFPRATPPPGVVKQAAAAAPAAASAQAAPAAAEHAAPSAPAQAAPAVQPAQQDAKNQRKTPRRRVLKEGKVIFGQTQAVIDCTIDNVSEGGAHIRLTSSHGLPEEFYLVEACRGVIHRAEVAWRTTTGMGLRILGPLEDAAARAAFLRKFKR